jgi:hypothetical protein
VEALTSHVRQVDVEASKRRRTIMPFLKAAIGLMRRSKAARRFIYRAQLKYDPKLYTDLFEKYNPNLVIASTPGWRLDRLPVAPGCQPRGKNRCCSGGLG